jgi:D-3-phosphoglycerate dehydrogenase
MARILITTSSFDVTTSPALAEIAAAGHQIVLNPFGRKLTEDEAVSLLADGVVGMVAGVEPLTRRVIEAARDLKVLARCGIGMDNVDMAAAAERGITVSNTPDGPSAAVAELTVGLMLDLLRHISANDRAIRAGQWDRPMGRLLGARVVGLVGCGRIGRRVAALVAAFGARVVGCDPLVDSAAGIEMMGFDEVLATADVVSLHLPYDRAVGCVMGAGQLGRMRKGAVLVNTARGGLVDEAALAAALESGALGGAAIDAFEAEPYSGPLAGLPTMVLSSHVGSYARETRQAQEAEAAANLLAGLRIAGLA